MLRLLSISDRDKVVEILALRHQITVLERQLGKTRPRFSPATGRSLQHCCTGSRPQCFIGSGYWCARRQCCCGTGTSSHNVTLPSPVPAARSTPDRPLHPAPGGGFHACSTSSSPM
jgi:hypothetical protein